MKITFGKVGALPAVGVLLSSPLAFAEPVAAPPAKPSVQPVASKPAKPPAFAELQRLFYRAADLFHTVEGEYSSGVESHPAKPEDLPRFKIAAEAAEKYLHAAALYESTAAPDAPLLTGLPVANYLAALSWYSAQDDQRALRHIEVLLKHYGDYRRPRGVVTAEAYQLAARPVKDNLLRLKLDIKERLGLYEKNAEPPAALDEAVADAVAALAARGEWIAEIVAHLHGYDQDMLLAWEDKDMTSDAARTRVLLPVEKVVERLHDKLILAALQKPGARSAVKAYLSARAQADGPFAQYLRAKLPDVDRILVAQLKQSAEAALAAKQHERAKTLFRQLKAEFGDDAKIAQYALGGINKIALGFKAQGDAVFDMRVLKPQTEALNFYKQMLEVEEAEPALKGYARFRMADALGGMGRPAEAVEQLRQAIAVWNAMTLEQRPTKPDDYDTPRSAQGATPLHYIEDAHYYLGFFTGAGLKDRDGGIDLHREFVAKFPASRWTPEAWHDMMLWHRWSGRHREAAAAARILAQRFPNTVRAANARDLLNGEYAKLTP